VIEDVSRAERPAVRKRGKLGNRAGGIEKQHPSWGRVHDERLLGKIKAGPDIPGFLLEKPDNTVGDRQKAPVIIRKAFP